MMNHQPLSVQKFPIWLYLNQPLFDYRYRAIVNPQRFWLSYRIHYLECCLVKEYRPEERSR